MCACVCVCVCVCVYVHFVVGWGVLRDANREKQCSRLRKIVLVGKYFAIESLSVWTVIAVCNGFSIAFDMSFRLVDYFHLPFNIKNRLGVVLCFIFQRQGRTREREMNLWWHDWNSFNQWYLSVASNTEIVCTRSGSSYHRCILSASHQHPHAACMRFSLHFVISSVISALRRPVR